jgi:hypothetical protein
VLQAGVGDLHTTRSPNRRVRNIPVTGNFVRGIDNHHAFVGLVGQDTGGLAQDGCFADAGSAEYQNAFAGANQVVDQPYRSVNGATDPAGQADRFASAVSHHGYSVESALDSGSVIVTKMPNMIHDMGNLFVGNFDFTQRNLFARESCFGVPAQVEYNLEQVPYVFSLTQCCGDFCWKNVDESFKVIDNLCVGVYQLELLLTC